MERILQFKKKFGWKGLICLPFYPIIVFITTPIRLVQTMWASRILLDGRWGNYPHFNATTGLGYLFYWTRAINLYRFGRAGISPYLGLGNYPLSRCFNYSLPSLYAYWVAGAVVPLGFIWGWWLLHIIWIRQTTTFWLLLVMTLSLISTTFYLNAFRSQNYNAVGWSFFSLGLYGMVTDQWLITGLAWFAASFGSFTVVFFALILSLVLSIISWDVNSLLSVIPAVLKLLTHFWPFFINGNTKNVIVSVLKAIGVIDTGVKYKRTTTKKFGIKNIYFSLLYFQFMFVSYFITYDFSVLFLTGFIIFLLNSTFVRIADDQSIYMLMFSLANVIMIQNTDLLLIFPYWLLVSPLPITIGLGIQKFYEVPKLSPFSIEKFIKGMEEFLSPIKQSERVFMAFDNPNGVYEKVFDGYRNLLELLHYVATKKDVHYMPDWWSVFELNYPGAIDFWGRDPESVKNNAQYWHADYIIIYEDEGMELDVKKWEDLGFEILTKFSWSDYANEFKGEKVCEGNLPDWYLLKIKTDDKT